MNDEYKRVIEQYNELLSKTRKLEKKYNDKVRQFNALVDYLKVKYEYSDYRIFNIIERNIKKSE